MFPAMFCKAGGLGLPLPIRNLQFQIHHAVRGARVLAFVFCRDCKCPSPPLTPVGSPSPALGTREKRSVISPVLGRNRYGHFNAFKGIVTAVTFGVDDAIGDFHAADDFSEGRVLTIQERRIGDADKKL